jgi:uncharacterized protein YjdB
MKQFTLSPRTILSLVFLSFIFISLPTAAQAYCTCSGSAYLQNLKVVSASDSMKVGDTVQFIVKGERVNITYTPNPGSFFDSCHQTATIQSFETSAGVISWNSSDASIINVDQQGVGTVLKQGSVKVGVPKNAKDAAVDDGAKYDSTKCS